MSAVAPQRDDVYEVETPEETRRSVREALAWCGLTYDELAQQAQRGDFDSVEARMAWITVQGLRDYV